MRLVSGTDPHIDKFVSHAREVHDSLEYMFGRCLYLDIVKRPFRPNNQIFFLRPGKKSELSMLDDRLVGIDQLPALKELRSLVKLALPKSIANFRIVQSRKNISEAVLINDAGEESSPRGLEYFRAKSSATMTKRCLVLGNFCWRGSVAMIEPFYKFCLGESIRHADS